MNNNLKQLVKVTNIILVCFIILGIICTILPLFFGHIGIAINGKIVDGVFFLGATGNFYRVSRLMFIISTLGTLLSPICTTVLVILYSLTDNSKVNSILAGIIFYGIAIIVGGGISLLSFFVLLFAILGINWK